MDEIKVSVVVPILDGARYLPQSVEFLKKQTRSDFEIIFVVDNRSTDNSVELAKELVGTLPQASVIVQDEGGGLGKNRNLGLDEAKGEYVWFDDVDDAPSPDFIKDMVALIDENDADFVCCNFVNTGPRGVVKEKRRAEYHVKTMNSAEAMISRNNDEFPVSSWSKLFRREFLLENGLRFEESFAEDIIHTYRCIEKCTRMTIYNRPLYAYRQTKGSICRCKENLDKRGADEIGAYCKADDITQDPVILKRNALMKIRSSGHMTYCGFMKYAKKDTTRKSYEKYLKGSFEGWWHRHLPTLYWLAIRTYVAVVYKRNGTKAMNKKFW